MTNKILFKSSKIYQPKIVEIQERIKKDNPILFVNKLCNLKLKKEKRIIIVHKLLKVAAEFEPYPYNKILLDFRNSLNYIFLCLAHEYAHILVRANISIPYPIEQSLAILIQLSYEDSVEIRKFKKKTAKELMECMNVWSVGKTLLAKWLLYWDIKKRKNTKYPNILFWLKKEFNFAGLTKLANKSSLSNHK